VIRVSEALQYEPAKSGFYNQWFILPQALAVLAHSSYQHLLLRFINLESTEVLMKAKVALIVILLGLTGIANANHNDDSVLVDTLYAVHSLTHSIYHNMETDDYMCYPNSSSLEILYGRSSFIGPGIIEARSIVTFQTTPVPEGYHIHSAEISLYCDWYWDNSHDWIWPHYYLTPYQVLIDHIQFESILPVVFGQAALAENVAVLQDSAHIGWVRTDVTESYLDDLQQSRSYSQYRLHFHPDYDVTGYQVDYVVYSRGPDSPPKLIVTYQNEVSNSDEAYTPESFLIKRLYPLPVHGILNIELEEKHRGTASLSLYDLKGRLVNSYDKLNFHNGPVQLQLPECPSGIYFIKVKAGRESEIRRISVIK